MTTDKITLHRDGYVTLWDPHSQQWAHLPAWDYTTAEPVHHATWATLDPAQRERVEAHGRKHGPPEGYYQAGIRYVPERIIELRKARGLSQAELGAAAFPHMDPGSAQVAVARYETGAREPKAEQLARLATALGCSVADLFD